MNQAVKSPVIINKYGKPTVVLISHEEYEKFNQLEEYIKLFTLQFISFMSLNNQLIN